MNDAELLRRYVEEGSEEAFAELVRLRIALVYSAALRQAGDPHRAQDITQTVFTELVRQAAVLRHHPALIGWLYTSTRFTARKLARAERRRSFWEKEASTMHEELASPEIPAERLRPLLDDAMHQLSEADRRALLLRFFDGCSMADLGRHMELPESTAKKRVERALEKLRGHLAKRGVSSTAAAVGIALGQEAAAATAPAGLAASVSGGALAAASLIVPGIGLVSFMTAQKLTAPVVLAAVVALFLAGSGAYHWQRSQDVQARLTILAQRFDARERQLAALAQSTMATERMLIESQKEIDNPHPTSPQPGPANVGTPNSVAFDAQPVLILSAANAARIATDWEQIAALHPDTRSIVASHYKTQFAAHHRLLFLQSRLHPAQFDAIATRVGEWQGRTTAISPGLNIFGAIIAVPLQGTDASEDSADAMRNEIEPLFQQSVKFPNPVTFDAKVVELSGRAGAPLTTDQEVRLVQIVAENSPQHKSGQLLDPNRVDWAKVAGKTQGLLSPTQWQAVQPLFLDFQNLQALGIPIGGNWTGPAGRRPRPNSGGK